MLSKRGNYEVSVNHFIMKRAYSPFINELGEVSLRDLVESGDTFLSKIAGLVESSSQRTLVEAKCPATEHRSASNTDIGMLA